MLKKIADAVVGVLTWISGTLLVGIVLCVVLAVLNRNFIKASIFWTEEVARILFVWFGMVSPAIGIAKDQHFRSSYLSDRFFKGRIENIYYLVVALVTLVTLMVYAKYGVDLAYSVRSQGLPTLQRSMSIMYAALPVGMIFMIITQIFAIIQKVKKIVLNKEINKVDYKDGVEKTRRIEI